MQRLDFPLDRKGSETLDRQLYNQMRLAILDGTMKPGQKVLSTRELAEALGISRSTAVDAYRQLIAEGYLDAKAKSNTFVCLELPETQKSGAPSKLTGRLSELGKKLLKMDFSLTAPEDLEIPFYSWRTSFEELPLEQWTRNLWRSYRASDSSMLDWAPQRSGSVRLRQMIATMVSQTRGIECDADQVIVVLGHQNALDLVARLFITRGDRVAVEEPCFTENRVTFTAYSAELIPIQVDDSGLVVDQLARKIKQDIKIVCVTPAHQYPTGAVLPMSRRLELLDWARKSGALIVEDDYDSEYRFVGQPIPALAGLDKSNLVVYIGTFSKVLYPSFGIGYMIVPKNLNALFENARRLSADGLPLQMQEALADFIEEGHLKRHIKHMRPIYEERRTALIHSLKQHLENRVTIYGDNAGLHVMARIKTIIPDQILIGRCAKAGVGLTSTANCYMTQAPRGEYIFGYGDLNTELIREGIRRLAGVIHHAD